jgi:hypothetical protein
MMPKNNIILNVLPARHPSYYGCVMSDYHPELKSSLSVILNLKT